MKFWMMKACAAVLGSTPGKFLMNCCDLGQLLRIQVVGLDDRHQNGGYRREDEGREGDRAQEEPVAQQVAALLDEDRPDEGEPHAAASASARSCSSRTPASPTNSR